MGRTIGELILLYLAPFAAYAFYLLLRQLYVLSFDNWTRRVLTSLSLTGLVLVLGALLYTGLFAERHAGAYQPAHIENGRLVPGEIQ